MFCGYLAVFMSAGVSSAVDCGGWAADVRALLICLGYVWCGAYGRSYLRWVFWGTFLGDGECDRMAGESCTLGTSLLGMSCYTSPPLAGRAPGDLCLGWECPASVARALFWWAGFVWVVVAELLWSASGGVRWMCGRVVPVLCGLVFSLSVDVKWYLRCPLG